MEVGARRDPGRDGSRETEAQGKEGSWASLCISEVQRDERGISGSAQGRQDREGQTGRTDRQGKADRERQTRVKRSRGYSRAEEAGGPGGYDGDTCVVL
ncbi:hypothetical protein V490_04307 [Pseudogymnoascus sp. VKM F-3557]|nr:hypothetical protein V490_04307 [Pseudogymnoascus sp. VKM F-3557]